MYFSSHENTFHKPCYLSTHIWIPGLQKFPGEWYTCTINQRFVGQRPWKGRGVHFLSLRTRTLPLSNPGAPRTPLPRRHSTRSVTFRGHEKRKTTAQATLLYFWSIYRYIGDTRRLSVQIDLWLRLSIFNCYPHYKGDAAEISNCTIEIIDYNNRCKPICDDDGVDTVHIFCVKKEVVLSNRIKLRWIDIINIRYKSINDNDISGLHIILWKEIIR